jgi:hypothetical protein
VQWSESVEERAWRTLVSKHMTHSALQNKESSLLIVGLSLSLDQVKRLFWKWISFLQLCNVLRNLFMRLRLTFSLILVPCSIDLVADELLFSYISIMWVKNTLLVQRTTLIAPPKEKKIISSKLCSNTITIF